MELKFIKIREVMMSFSKKWLIVGFMFVISAQGYAFGPGYGSMSTYKRSDKSPEKRIDPFPLHTAVRNGDLDLCTTLIQSDSTKVDTKDRYKRTPLDLAVRRENIEIVDLLLKAGANPRACDTTETPILYGVLYLKDSKAQEAILRKLIEYKADIGVKIKGTGITVLSKAVDEYNTFGKEQDYNLCKLLLELGARPFVTPYMPTKLKELMVVYTKKNEEKSKPQIINSTTLSALSEMALTQSSSTVGLSPSSQTMNEESKKSVTKTQTD